MNHLHIFGGNAGWSPISPRPCSAGGRGILLGLFTSAYTGGGGGGGGGSGGGTIGERVRRSRGATGGGVLLSVIMIILITISHIVSLQLHLKQKCLNFDCY